MIVGILQVHLPRGGRVEAFVSGVAAPKALNQHRSRWYLPVKMFLTLLLLYFQCKAGSEYTLMNKDSVLQRLETESDKDKHIMQL